MDAPTYTKPQTDPTVAAVQTRAASDDIKALQETAGIDTAALMARFGTRRAMAGTSPGVSPLLAPPSTV